MVESGSNFDDLEVVLALRRENESLQGELSNLQVEERRLLFEHSTAKAEFLSRAKAGSSALASDVNLSRREDREKILLESASRLEYWIGNDMAPSYRVRADGVIISGNNACAKLLGYPRERFYDGSLSVEQIVPPELAVIEKECLRDFDEMMVTRTVVSERIGADGSRIPLACNFRLTKADGSQWACFLLDLSESKALEEELKQRQALFSTLVGDMPNIAFLVEDSGRTWQFNRRFYELTGLDPANEDGFFPTAVTHPDDLVQSQARWQAAMAEHQPLIGEIRVRAADGQDYWHIFRAIPLTSPLPGQLEGLWQLAQAICPQAAELIDKSRKNFWIGTATDIDRRKRIIDEVLESAYNFQSLADQIPQIVWTAGPDGRIDFFNNRWFEFSGLDREHRVGLDFALFIHSEDRRRYVDTWKSCVKTGDALDVEFRLKKKDSDAGDFEENAYKNFLARAVAVRNPRGDIEQWVGTWTSI
jgi:PAS domain S-box-containing protein